MFLYILQINTFFHPFLLFSFLYITHTSKEGGSFQSSGCSTWSCLHADSKLSSSSQSLLAPGPNWAVFAQKFDFSMAYPWYNMDADHNKHIQWKNLSQLSWDVLLVLRVWHGGQLQGLEIYNTGITDNNIRWNYLSCLLSLFFQLDFFYDCVADWPGHVFFPFLFWSNVAIVFQLVCFSFFSVTSKICL